MKIILKISMLWLLLVSCPALAVEFSLFGDTTLLKKEDSQQFNLGGLNLIADQEVSDSSVVIAEVLFEFAKHGYEANLTRLSITHKLNPSIEIYAGKFVKGLGLWHQTFHHGSLALDTISLPFFIGGENEHHSFVAAHIVGAGVSVSLGDFSYQIALANQPGIDSSSASVDGLSIIQLDRNSPTTDFATLMKFNYNINWKTEVSFFTHIRDVVELDSTVYAIGDAANNSLGVEYGEALFEQQQYGFNFLYAGDKFSTFLEYYQLLTKDKASFNIPLTNRQSSSYDASMYYLQLGWKFTDALSASVRFEGLDYSADNSFFRVINVAKQTRNVMGVNFRFAESNAIRFEVNQIDYDQNFSNLKSETQFGLQWFFLLL